MVGLTDRQWVQAAGAHTLSEPVVNGANRPIDGLNAPAEPFNLGERFVCPDRSGVLARLGGQADTDDTDAVAVMSALAVASFVAGATIRLAISATTKSRHPGPSPGPESAAKPAKGLRSRTLGLECALHLSNI